MAPYFLSEVKKMNKEIAVKVMQDLLDLGKSNVYIEKYSKIFINLNSILNNLFYEKMVTEITHDFILDYKDKFKGALLNTYRADKTYYIYYSTEKSNNSEKYADWDSYLNKYKFDDVLNKLFHEFISAMKKLEDEFTNIEMIDTKDTESAIVPFLYRKDHSISDECLVVSRDMMDFINIKYGFHIFDGITVFKDMFEHNSKKIPTMSHKIIGEYLFLTGIKKHSYKGIKGYGPKTALRHIYKHVSELDKMDLFKDKSFDIFNFKKYTTNIVV